jgi:hypothetical protein
MRKLVEEQKLDDMDTLIYKLPFKMKVQSILEQNKAIDERTKDDTDRKELEA